MDTNESQFIELPESRALGRVLSQPWLITEDALMDILRISSRTDLNVERAVAIAEEKRKARFEMASGEWLKGTRSVMVTTDGVAIVPVYDSLFRRADLFSSMSGAMSMETIERDFNVAAGTKKVSSIVLDVDSPGGEVNYTEHLANSIKAAREIKPVEAFCSGLMASGAMWIGSAASKRTITKTAMVGSVGVYSAYVSTKKMEEKMGIKRIKIVSSFSPKKVPDPETPEGEAEILRMVNSLADVFAETVADNMGISVEQVKGWQGAVMVGKDAVAANMAEEIGYFDAVLGRLGSTPTVAQASVGIDLQASTDEPEPEEVEETVEDDDNVLEIVVDDRETVQEDEEEQSDESLDNTGETMPEQNNSNKPTQEEAQSAWGVISGFFGGQPKGTTKPVAAAPTAPVEKSEQQKKIEAKAIDGFLAGTSDRVMPASREPLKALYEAALEAGCEDKVEAFVNSIPAHGFMQDRIPVGAGYLTPTQSAEEEDEEIKAAREVASEMAKDESGTTA